MGNQKSALRPEVISDLQHTTAFSNTEIADLYRQFIHDCKEGDMEMTLESFKEMYMNVFPMGDAGKFAEHVFRTFDKEDKGRIDFRQFMTTLSVQLKGSQQERLEWAFDLYDIHKNGYITRSEALDMIQVLHSLQMGALPAEDKLTADDLVTHIFKRASAEHPDRLTRQEFLKASMESKTMHRIIKGSWDMAGSPLTQRKQRTGSFGRPRTGSRSGSVSSTH